MQLELNEQERDELVRLLTAACAELSSEIHHAMDHATRDSFRQNQALLRGLLDRLGAKAQAAR